LGDPGGVTYSSLGDVSVLGLNRFCSVSVRPNPVRGLNSGCCGAVTARRSLRSSTS